MGNYTSTPPWEYVEGPNNESYDQFGYVPGGLKFPTQRVWAVPNEQFPLHTLMAEDPVKQPYGVVNGPLRTFGSGEWTKLWEQGMIVNSGTTPETGDVFNKVIREPGKASTWVDHPSLPTPDTYPLGKDGKPADFTPMRDAAAIVQMYDGKNYNIMDAYVEAAEQSFDRAYVNGGFEAMKEVNENDTSTYDPCDNPTIFEVMLPLTMAVAVGGVYMRLIFPALEAAGVPSQASAAAGIGLTSFAWNIARASLETLGEPSQYYTNAARSLIYPGAVFGGVYLGDQLFQQTTVRLTQPQFEIASSGALIMLLQPFVDDLAHALEVANFGAGVVIAVFRSIVGGISWFWCRLGADSYDACQDKDKHATGRRWDVGAIAGRLTDEVVEREGWERDSEQARFVFEGLLRGPSMMMAADTRAGHRIWDIAFANPMGEIYETPWQQLKNKDFPTGTGYGMTGAVFGWDGDTNKSSWDVANMNLYACQNWDVMRHGDQDHGDARSTALAETFDNWIGNWEEGGNLGALVEKANDPNFIHQAKQIKGWDPLAVRLDPSCEELIASILNSESVHARAAAANYAAADIIKKTADCDPQSVAWIDANSKFYEYMLSNNAHFTLTAEQIWDWTEKRIFTGYTPQQLSAALYAIGSFPSTQPKDDPGGSGVRMHGIWLPKDFKGLWDLPGGQNWKMWKAMKEFPPPGKVPYAKWLPPLEPIVQEPVLLHPPPFQPMMNAFTTVLFAPTLAKRHEAAKSMKPPYDPNKPLLDLWFIANDLVYDWIVDRPDSSKLRPSDLTKDTLDTIFGKGWDTGIYPKGLSNEPQYIQDAVWWAIMTWPVPGPKTQKCFSNHLWKETMCNNVTLFWNFWAWGGGVYPKTPKPDYYPDNVPEGGQQ